MLWVKAFHIISMVCWFAGLFYLPRLFVYHAMAKDEISLNRFKTMEAKLYYGITTPATFLTIVFGIWLVWFNPTGYMHMGWFHAKIFLVILLLGYQHYLGHLLKKFARNQNQHSDLFYRILNEIPVFFLMSIVLLVILKPF